MPKYRENSQQMTSSCKILQFSALELFMTWLNDLPVEISVRLFTHAGIIAVCMLVSKQTEIEPNIIDIPETVCLSSPRLIFSPTSALSRNLF